MVNSGFMCKKIIFRVSEYVSCFIFMLQYVFGYLFCFLMHDIKGNFAHPGVSLTRHAFTASVICISSLLDFYLHDGNEGP